MATVSLPTDKFDTDLTFVKPDPAPTRAPLDKLAVLPGFNTRVKDADYSERVTTIAESIANHGFFDDKPFAVVMLPGDDTIYIYDGEHRFDGAKQALLDGAEFPNGLPIAWAKDGATVRDLTIHLAHGNNGERLNMVESASVVRRMQGLGMTKAEIAEAFGRTARHIDNLFVLASANQTVKKAVATGKIAGAEAVKLLRKDPKTAATKIADAVKAAEEKGKAKATPKTMEGGEPAPKGPKTKTVPMSINFPVGAKMGDVLKSMASMIREVVEIGDGDLVKADALLRFSVTTIDRDAEAEAAKKAAEKAARAEESARLKAEHLAKREEAAKEKAAKKAAEQADKAAKKAAEDALLAEAKAKGSDAKKPPKISAEEAKRRAQAHLSRGKTEETVKAAEKDKPRRTRRKAGETKSEPAGTPAPETGESTPAALPDESMGGL